jgi:NADPH:quinone reductase-like Zn-dependent oxidoreductase
MIVKAVIWTKYGPPEVLKLKEVPKPEPKDNEILIKVHASTVTAGDCEMRSLQLPLYFVFLIRIYMGMIRPKRVNILGQELAGEVEAVGKNVKQLSKGDRVFGHPGFTMGSYAEYKCLPESSDTGVLIKQPKGLTHEESASIIVGGIESLHFLGKANIKSGDNILINGAGGSIGTFSVQYAKSLGAEVTAVDSAGKLKMLRSIGADQVIDYEKEDLSQSGETYDVIFDVVGKIPFSTGIKLLKNNGCYLIAFPRMSHRFGKLLTSKKSGKKIIKEYSKYTKDSFQNLKDVVEMHGIKPVIDRRYPLEQTADAHRYVDSGQKKGSVIINIVHDSK